MRAVTAAQMQRADRLTVMRYGIPVFLLMDNAGRAVAEAARQLVEGRRGKAGRRRKVEGGRRIMVLCGSGNNGGDGVAAARYLHHWGYRVQVLWLKNPRHWEGDIALHYRMAKAMGVCFEKFIANSRKQIAKIKKSVCIIDALLGTGTRGEIRGAYRDAIEIINHARQPVVSVDIPSGLDADIGKPLGIAVKATVTVTMAAPKVGMLKSSARRYVGKLIVADIGIPKELLKIR